MIAQCGGDAQDAVGMCWQQARRTQYGGFVVKARKPGTEMNDKMNLLYFVLVAPPSEVGAVMFISTQHQL